MSLFGPGGDQPEAKPVGDETVRLHLLITVKAAPQPSESYGETVCVAGVSMDLQHPRWVRLYPIGFRFLAGSDQFRKYDVVEVDAKPARADSRRESWRPQMDTLVVHRNLSNWRHRRSWLDPYLDERSMCQLIRDAREDPVSRSVGLVEVAEIGGVVVAPHPGWTAEEQRKIDRYAQQPFLFGKQDPAPLQAPRFQVQYRYRCTDRGCPGHRQSLVDWEAVAFQHRMAGESDSHVRRELERKCREVVSAPDRITAFYVGNQAGRRQTFSIGGVYYPPR